MYTLKEESKDWIVYNIMSGGYSIMSDNHLDRVNREFGDTTHNGKYYPYTDELWSEFKDYKEEGVMRKIINKFINLGIENN